MLSKDVDGDWVRFAYMIHPDGTIHRPTELATDLNGPRHDLDPFEPGSVFHRSVDVCSPAQAANWMTYGHRKEQIRSLEPRSFEWPTDPRELSAQKEYYRKFRPTFPPWYTELLSDCTANAEHLLKLGSGEELSEEARVASAGAQRLKLLVSVPTMSWDLLREMIRDADEAMFPAGDQSALFSADAMTWSAAASVIPSAIPRSATAPSLSSLAFTSRQMTPRSPAHTPRSPSITALSNLIGEHSARRGHHLVNMKDDGTSTPKAQRSTRYSPASLENSPYFPPKNGEQPPIFYRNPTRTKPAVTVSEARAEVPRNKLRDESQDTPSTPSRPSWRVHRNRASGSWTTDPFPVVLLTPTVAKAVTKGLAPPSPPPPTIPPPVSVNPTPGTNFRERTRRARAAAGWRADRSFAKGPWYGASLVLAVMLTIVISFMTFVGSLSRPVDLEHSCVASARGKTHCIGGEGMAIGKTSLDLFKSNSVWSGIAADLEILQWAPATSEQIHEDRLPSCSVPPFEDVSPLHVLEELRMRILPADKALQNLFVHNLGPGDAVGAAKRMRKMESSMTFLNNDNGGVKMPTVSPSTTAPIPDRRVTDAEDAIILGNTTTPSSFPFTPSTMSQSHDKTDEAGSEQWQARRGRRRRASIVF